MQIKLLYIYFFNCLGYPELGRYLNKTGRQIVYSCSWPAYQEGQEMLVSCYSI